MKYRYPQLLNKEWLAGELKIKSKLQIAEEIGANYSSVTWYARKHNIEVGRSGPRRPSLTRAENVKAALRKKYPKGRRGEAAANWRGGIRKGLGAKHQYIGVYSPEHPNATKCGYVMEHRLVMEKSLGRYLTPKEIVHHRNGDKKDNRLENLELVSDRGTHTRNHFERSHVNDPEIERLRSLLEQNGIDPDTTCSIISYRGI